MQKTVNVKKKSVAQECDWLLEPARRLPVGLETDVVVVGGGIAGVAAALAAARAGSRVCLLEKEFALGGLATLGLVTVYLPLCDGRGRQVTWGLAEELLKLSVKDPSGAIEDIPACWRRGGRAADRRQARYLTRFNPASYILDLDCLVTSAGVQLLFDTRACALAMQGRRIAAVIVENKDGRSAISCRSVVDASGDADICALAGEPTLSLQTNVAAGWYYAQHAQGLQLNKLTEKFDFQGRCPPDGIRGYSGDVAADVTEQMLHSRRNIGAHLRRLRQAVPGAVIYPVLLPAIPCMRMTRRLDGRGHLEEGDAGVAQPDAVGAVGHWRKPGHVYHLPYRSLAAQRTDNLLAAGRCITTGETGWDITRVIPACALSGQSAGLAAHLLARNGGTARRLKLERLRELLLKQGCRMPVRLPQPPARPAADSAAALDH